MKKLNRRSFIKKSGMAVGAAGLLSTGILPKLALADTPSAKAKIYISNTKDIVEGTRNVLEAMGGIESFVKSGQSVGILANSPWKHIGYYTHPAMVLALGKLCLDAGAREVVVFKPVPDDYWTKHELSDELRAVIDKVRYSDERTDVELPEGIALKKATIFKDLLDVDVFINIPIAKHHNGTVYSGVLKGLMGASDRTTNRYMHSPDGEYTYSKTEYLSQCIADLNLIRLPDLSIVDGIECGIEAGPRGPGETVRPRQVFAGTDAVALDTYGVKLLGFDTSDVPQLAMSEKHQLGSMDYKLIDK